MGLYFLIRNFIQTKSPIIRAQIRWILWACTVFVPVMVVAYSLPILLGDSFADNSLSYMLPAAGFLLFPLSVIWALTQFRLQHARGILLQTLMWGGSILVAVLCFIGFDSWVGAEQSAKMYFLVGSICFWGPMLVTAPLRARLHTFRLTVSGKNPTIQNQFFHQLTEGFLTQQSVEGLLERFGNQIGHYFHGRCFAVTLFPNAVHGCVAASSSRGAWILGPKKELALRTLYKGEKSSKAVTFNPKAIWSPRTPGFEGLFCSVVHKEHWLGYVVVLDKGGRELFSQNDLKLLEVASYILGLWISSFSILAMNARLSSDLTKERELISRDIHDSVGSLIGGAQRLISNYQEGISPKEAMSITISLTQVLRNAQAQFRDLLWACDSACVRWADFWTYLLTHLQKQFPSEVVELRFVSGITEENGLQICVGGQYKLHLLRMVQEICNNALRHGRASWLQITCYVEEGRVVLTCLENGPGFSISQVQKGRGLRNLESRSSEIGGRLEWRQEQDGFRSIISFSLVHCPSQCPLPEPLLHPEN